MDGVRIIARVWGVLGWLTLAISAIALILVLSQLGQYTNARGPGGLTAQIGALAGAMVPVFLLALGPFTVWAGLTALCDVRERQQEILGEMRATGRVSAGSARAEWANTNTGIRTGYVVRPASPATDNKCCEYEKGQRVRLVREMTLYDGNGLDGPVLKLSSLKKAPQGTPAVVTAVREDWVRIQTDDGDDALVNAKDLSPETA